MTKTVDFDPNLTLCGRMATQTVRLTFALWQYRAEMVEKISGNCTGLFVIEDAVESAFEKIEGDRGYACINLKNADGDVLVYCDDDGRGYEWLKDVLVGAEITDIKAKQL